MQPSQVQLSHLTLAFVTDWDGDGEIYTVQADGSGLVQITDNATKEALPKWSPDGRQLAYIDDLYRTSRLVVSDADGSNASIVAPDLEATWEVVWSPTGRQVVFRNALFQSGDLIAVDVQTGEEVNLTRGAPFAPGRPSFSPEGGRMVFSVSMPDSAGPPSDRLFTVRADGTELTELSFPAGDADYWPMWHPLRDEILFQGLVQGQGVGLYVATLDGSITRLRAEPRYLVSFPSWSPDGTMIAYVALESEQSVELHVATETEDMDEVVLDSEMAGEEYLGINRFYWAPGSRQVAFFGSGGAYSADTIYVLDICEGQPRMVVEAVDPDSELSWRPLPER
jgi:TolB protein